MPIDDTKNDDYVGSVWKYAPNGATCIILGLYTEMWDDCSIQTQFYPRSTMYEESDVWIRLA